DHPAVFLIHPSSGLGWSYLGLLKHIKRGRPTYAIQAPTLTERDSRCSNLRELAQHYAELVQDIQPQGPYHLVGWSFGGTVAHQMAHELQIRGTDVGLLAVLDGYPNSRHTPAPAPTQRATQTAALSAICGRSVSEEEL